MKLVQVNWQPTVRHSRQFAAAALVMLPTLGWLWGGRWGTVAALACAGTLLTGLSIVAPRAVKPIYLGAMLVSLPIGIVICELMLLTIFYLVFLPIGLLSRLMGRDAMDRRLDRSAASYWRPKPQPRNAGSYFRLS